MAPPVSAFLLVMGLSCLIAAQVGVIYVQRRLRLPLMLNFRIGDASSLLPQAVDVPDAPAACTPAMRKNIKWGVATSSYQVNGHSSTSMYTAS